VPQTASKSAVKSAKRVKTGGRQRVLITPEIQQQVEQLASICVKNRDIAIITGIPENVLERKFRAVLVKNRAAARAKLIEKQWKIADSSGNGALGACVWLGKNYAEQTDRQDITASEGLKVIVERIG
jgi:UDP-N-acetylenolpyruvoylglucosamine reductase